VAEEWVLAGATVVLALATFGLVVFTWKLVVATRQLSEVERQRERRETRRRKAAQLARKIFLAEQVIGAKLESVRNQSAAGHPPNPEASYINEIASLVEPGDQILPADIADLQIAFDNALKGGANRSTNQAEAIQVIFHRVQERLGWDLTRWRHELAELTPELPPQ